MNGKCFLCDERPISGKAREQGKLYCFLCFKDSIEQERAEKEARLRRRHNAPTYLPQYWQIYHWKGHLVGAKLRPLDPKLPVENQPQVTVRYIGLGQPSDVPKKQLIDMGLWQPGYTAEQVKKIKATLSKLLPPPLKFTQLEE